MVSAAFVILMSIPGLALFYGGLVRSKNMLSVLMQVFAVFSLISVLWVVYGYSVAQTLVHVLSKCGDTLTGLTNCDNTRPRLLSRLDNIVI